MSGIGLLANVGAVPLMALATYLGMLALLLWPLGAQGPALALMGQIVALVNDWAMRLSAWQGQVGIDTHWWPLMALLGVLTIGAVLLRLWWAVALTVLASATLAWGLAALVQPADILVLDDGKAGLVRDGAAYRLAWAERPTDALYLTDRAGLKLHDSQTSIPTTVDDALMPVFNKEHFAWAAKYGQTWHVEPPRCGRIWQRSDPLCWTDY